jgi:hypothetical protein
MGVCFPWRLARSRMVVARFPDVCFCAVFLITSTEFWWEGFPYLAPTAECARPDRCPSATYLASIFCCFLAAIMLALGSIDFYPDRMLRVVCVSTYVWHGTLE